MNHSGKLEDTVLWKVYEEKVDLNRERSSWVKEVYDAAAKYLMDVRQTFQNYTLHDERHILNVLDAMGGLLGNQIIQLTVGEAELLILAACLHDLGMVYTKEEEQQCYQDEKKCRKFLREYCPGLLGYPVEDWAEDIRKWYLRTLHPFRLSEVLQKGAWKELLDRCPSEVVPKRCIIAVCQAHGENLTVFCNNNDLNYMYADATDPLFCAILLRLGDLLDFDDTRAPRILYSYVTCNDKSRAEWDKHLASAGFRYPESPSTNALPYKARCTNPEVEHAVRDFLDWIDEELGNCVKLQQYCKMEWQQKFRFPRAVLRDEIESDGYMSGDFSLTMDQAQILELLTGENLYNNTDVFIRELLQNAIDATLLRGELDSNFIPEESRIDLWEWNDKEGNVWFRIDDEGTGMTLGMLKRYFLKVGNSYYNSRELERDLKDYGPTKQYNGISRFGIGFLSSFLCGDYAEVSTLYFDSKKNQREEEFFESYQTMDYGLRLQLTGLSGYNTLKSQSKHHQADGQLPAPPNYAPDIQSRFEKEGYRAKPGTSIVIRLEPGKLGTLNLREATEKYLFGARVPVYYNNKRIGKTYEEVMREAHKVEGEKIYELTLEMKEQFDQSFPAARGQYPKIVMSVVPLDTEENQVLPEFSGLIVRYDVRFDKIPQWKMKDQTYEVYGEVNIKKNPIELILWSGNVNEISSYAVDWESWKNEYGSEEVAALEEEFEKWSICPKVEDIIEKWKPFSEKMDLYGVWKIYNDSQQKREMRLPVAGCGCSDTELLPYDNQYRGITCVYQGIVAGDFEQQFPMKYNVSATFLLGNIWKPTVSINRSEVTSLPLKVLIAISGILNKYQMLSAAAIGWGNLGGWKNSSLKEWREARTSGIDQWMQKNQEDFFIENKQTLQKELKTSYILKFAISTYNCNYYAIIYKYLMSYFQDNYQMTINYEDGQIISFDEKIDHEIDDTLDLFPPMMFCKAASNRSRRYICSEGIMERRCITLDHPFIMWLLDNAAQLKQYYKRQFLQIVDCLCQSYAEDIIKECNNIREQLIVLPEHRGVNVKACPQLSMDDFWIL